MKNQSLAPVIGVSVVHRAMRTPKRLLLEPAGHCFYSWFRLFSGKVGRINKLGEKANNLANGIRERVRLGSMVSESLKRKLSLGAKILQSGGVQKIFKHHFSVSEGEKLVKASQCFLSTTAGPIPGLLFISTDKIAFLSDKSIKLSSVNGEWIRIRYKVVIPVAKLLAANERRNEKRRSQKYIQIVTVDNFDFWFMEFLSYQKTLNYLQLAIS